MRNLPFGTAIVCAICFGYPAPAGADLPRTIVFQGTLKDAAGKPIASTRSVTFTLYDAATAGNAAWSESKDIGPDASGLFATSLGSVTPLTSVIFDKAYWIGVKVGSDAEMAPRLALNTVPYALALPGVTMAPNGNIGLGTPPFYRLQLIQPLGQKVGLFIGEGNGSDGGHTDMRFGLSAPTGGYGYVQTVRSAGNAYGDIVLNPDGGNVGIGTVSPSAKLDIGGGIHASSDISTDGNLQLGRFTGGHNKLAILGANSPANFEGSYQDVSFEFGSAGSAKIRSYRGDSWDTYLQFLTTPINAGSDSPRRVFELFGDGNAWLLGSLTCNTLTLTSSRRYKRHIEPIHDALGTITRLQGVTYDWDAPHGGSHDLGFIAEDAGRVLPELVAWEPNGRDAKGMDYSHLVALTVEGIKEQQGQAIEQQKRIKNLETENEDLRTRLERVEAIVERGGKP